MKQEDKQLLLQDLCARLPYKPKIQWDCADYDLLALENCEPLLARIIDDSPYSYAISKPLDEIKPYLRPMSSMTEEEKQELERLINEKLNRNTDQEDNEWTPWVLYDTTGIRNSIGGERFYFDEMSFIYDWLNAHHFDYRGLIEKGLAIEAPEGMYI